MWAVHDLLSLLLETCTMSGLARRKRNKDAWDPVPAFRSSQLRRGFRNINIKHSSVCWAHTPDNGECLGGYLPLLGQQPRKAFWRQGTQTFILKDEWKLLLVAEEKEMSACPKENACRPISLNPFLLLPHPRWCFYIASIPSERGVIYVMFLCFLLLPFYCKEWRKGLYLWTAVSLASTTGS